ncbi:MAG: NrsF family protein [Magnetococcus sp. WYHC-3]
MTEDKIDEMIEKLCCCDKSRKAMCHPLLRLLPWVVVLALYVVFAVGYIGVRTDIEAKMMDMHFLFEIGLAAFIGISAAICAAWLAVPDMCGHKGLLALPLTGLGVFAFWSTLSGFTGEWGWPGVLEFQHCHSDATLIAVVPALAMAFFIRKGATTCPFLAAFMTALAAGGMGYISLRMTCSMDTVGHVLVFHLAPFIALGMILGLLARKIYKW